MTARYEVLCGDDFMAMEDIQWPEGFRPIEQRAAEPYCHWWLFEDDNADPSLDGQRVELQIEVRNGVRPDEFGTPEYYSGSFIVSRNLVTW